MTEILPSSTVISSANLVPFINNNSRNSSVFIDDAKRISDDTKTSSNYGSYINLHTASISSSSQIQMKKAPPTATITSSYYKQIEMSKAARGRRKHE